MICKIIEDDYTFEQIESIEAIEELEKKYNLNISIEDKTYPKLYPEIGLITSYKVYKNDKLWNHTQMRIDNALKKANGDNEKFTSQMVTRLKRIGHEEKLYYSIAVLKEMGYENIVDMYEGKVLINEMMKYNENRD
jgi:hypothetical protein